MKKISVPTRNEVSPESQLLFDVLQKRTGKIPNLYAAMGYSSFALKGFMSLEEALSGGVFSAKEREAVALVVSEVNSCEYCLAGHTLLAMKRGFTKEETHHIRRAQIDDPKLNSVIQLAKAIAETRGKAPDEYLSKFYEAGYDVGALMELTGLIVVRLFTNYVFALTNVPIDFPLSDPLN